MPDECVNGLHRFDKLVAAYLARFPGKLDPDAADDADIDQMSADMVRGLAGGEPVPYLLPPLDSMAAQRRAMSRQRRQAF